MNLNRNGCFLKGDVFLDLHPASDETVILKLKWTEKPMFFRGNLCSHRKEGRRRR